MPYIMGITNQRRIEMAKRGRPRKGEIRTPARPFENMTTGHRLEHEGKFWIIDAKAFYKADHIVLRVYRIHGDVGSRDIVEAIDDLGTSLMCSQNMSVRIEANL